jgi:LCP family protein required for cell wall assembly
MGHRSTASQSPHRPALTPIRHGRTLRSHPIATIVKVLAGVVAVLLVSTTSIVAVAVYGTVSSIPTGIHLTHLAGASAAPAAPSIGPYEGEVNILLAGSDTRANQVGFQSKAELAASSGTGNNDVTMLLHISANHTSATVVSFPRDLVSIPLCGKGISAAMFNTTLARGLSCTVNTVEKMTGQTIPFAGIIKFNGVSAMSTAVGGVTVCLADPIKDPYTQPIQLDLPAGQQSLVGDLALSFLRSRHGIGNGGDLGRISNQQLFLSALTRKIVSGGVLSNPLTLYKLANAAEANVALSDTLTPTTLVSIALALKGLDLSKIVFVQYPTGADPADPNRVVPLLAAGAALAAALKSDQPISLTGSLGDATIADPNTVPTPTPTPSGPATTAPAPAPAPSTIALPSTITGQRADQSTCTKGFSNHK